MGSFGRDRLGTRIPLHDVLEEQCGRVADHLDRAGRHGATEGDGQEAVLIN
jgi:hypothetical protein